MQSGAGTMHTLNSGSKMTFMELEMFRQSLALLALALCPVISLAADLSVMTENGFSTVQFNGRKVWSGKTTGKVAAKSASVNGKEYAAVFEGSKLLWESEKGAAGKVR